MFSFFKPTLSKIILSIFLVVLYYVLLLLPPPSAIGLPAEILLYTFAIIFLFFTLITLNFLGGLNQFLNSVSVPYGMTLTIVSIVQFILLALYVYVTACILLPIIAYYTPKRLQKSFNVKGIKKGLNIFDDK